MADTWRENAIVQAIQIIADKKIAQAGYDKTYKGVVNKILDKTTGKYEIKYQDSLIEAYATSSEIYYSEGQEVSFLVPGNDWDRMKTIVGGIESTALTYNEVQEISEKYNKTGPSAVSGRYELSSYGYEYIDIIDNLGINQEIIDNYVKNGNGLVLGMNVQTNLATSQVGGEYGLVFNLKFKDSVTGAAAVRQYVVNSKDVIGNPYFVTRQTPVERLFEDVDLENLDSIQSVYVYCEKFPQDQSKTGIKDIIISNIRLNGAQVLTQDDLNGYSVHIDYSQTGNILQDKEESQTGEIIREEISIVTLKGILKVKGKTISSDVNYYWFRQNGMVLRGHEKYSNYGGDGWECLNHFANGKAVPFTTNSISFTTENGSENPVSAVDKNTRVKCVAVFDYKNTEGFGNVYNRTITTDVIIESSDKRQGVNDNKVDYYLDAGHPTLTCHIKPEEENYKYYWTVVPARGKAESRESDQVKRTDYLEKEGKWIEVQNYANSLAVADAEAYIHNDENAADEESQYHKYYNPDSPLFAEYTNAKENFEQVQFAPYVYENVYYNFPIREISDYIKVICTVVQVVKDEQGNQKENYKGSASITLYNHMQVPSTYNLNIENGTQVFQYDGKGNSPASPQFEKPIQILPLTFTLIDDEGNEVSYDQIINNGYVEWMIPKNNTLLISKGNDQTKKIDYNTATGTDRTLAADYDIYKNIPSFSYTIAPVYDAKLTNNYIRLDIKYKDMLFSAYTDFTFPKDGDPGTNGTDYVVKISPTTSTDRVYISNKFPEVLFDDDGNIIKNLKFQVYNNSRIVENASANLWTCPPKGASGDSDRGNTYIEITYDLTEKPNECLIKTEEKTEYDIFKDKPINIVRAHYKNGDLNQYAEYPICYNYLESDIEYRFKIKPKTGFKYVVYQEDGTSPQYDNTLPFEVVVEKKDSNTDYYIIQDNGLSYEWFAIGEIEVDSNRSNGLNENQKYYKPKDKFDGSDLTSAIVIKIKQNDNYIGYIHVPIYMILNRYGHSAINNWDGNSIQMKEGGDIILAPQVGAGTKNNDNQFTGVLIGDVKASPKNQQGLFGYHNGERTIFFDAQTGKAQFGKQGAGKIIFNPNEKINNKDTALIYSGNYPIDDFKNTDKGNYNVKTTGELQNNRNKNNKGLMIDLSTPQIGFGSGNFTVNSKGQLVARGGGQIAGWTINDTKLYKDNKVGMASSNETVPTDINLKIDNDDTTAFWAGGTLNTSGANNGKLKSANFYVTHGGYLYSKRGRIAKWNIDENILQHTDGKVGMGTGSNKTFHYTDSSNNSTSISITNPRFWAINGSKQCIIDNNGKLWVNEARIGPWLVDQSKLSNGYTGLGSNLISSTDMNNAFGSGTTSNGIQARIWASTANTNKSVNFVVSNDGKLYSKAGKIGGWNIEKDKLWSINKDSGEGIRLNSNGSMTGGATGTDWAIAKDGTATFKKLIANKQGFIAGWKITSNALKGGNDGKGGTTMNINSEGSMSGPGWSITSNGNATFNYINGKIANATTGGTASLTSGNYSSGGTGYTLNSDGTFGFNGGGTSIGYNGKTLDIGPWSINSNGIYYKTDDRIHIYPTGISLVTGNDITNITGSSVISEAIQAKDHFSLKTAIGKTGVITFTDGSAIHVTGGIITYVKGGEDAIYIGN